MDSLNLGDEDSWPRKREGREILMPLAAPVLGRPYVKANFGILNILATLSTVVTFLLACLVVDPRSWLAWRLGFQQQLTVLGFLLALQSLCLQRLYYKTFPAVEARFGASRLQNYQAILSNSFLTAHTSWTWRTIILLCTVLPLGLSAAYKQFDGGWSVRRFENTTVSFATAAPPGLNTGYVTGTRTMNNLTQPFLHATVDEAAVADLLDGRPHAFGFNTLLLSNTSVAMLDSPTASTVYALQSQLRQYETHLLSAPVKGLVAYQNVSIDALRNDAQFWRNSSLPDFWDTGVSQGQGGLSLYPFTVSDGVMTTFALMLLTATHSGEGEDHTWLMFNIQETDDVATFIAGAQMFNFTYNTCQATWKISSDSIELDSGSCTDAVIPWSSAPNYHLDNNEMAIDTFFLPTLAEVLGDFAVYRNASAFKIPTMAAAAAAMTYSRVAAYNTDPAAANVSINTYNLTATLSSRRAAMQNFWTLYVVIAAQPLLTIGFLLLYRYLHHVPIDVGFGLISILAGVDTTSLSWLRGAESSGELSEAVPMRIEVVSPEMQLSSQLNTLSEPEDSRPLIARKPLNKAWGVEETNIELFPLSSAVSPDISGTMSRTRFDVVPTAQTRVVYKINASPLPSRQRALRWRAAYRQAAVPVAAS